MLVAVIAHSDQTYSPDEVAAAFAAEGVSLDIYRTSGCPHLWTFRVQPLPEQQCPVAMLSTPLLEPEIAVTVFRDSATVARLLERRREFPGELITGRANVLVFTERSNPAVEAALAALD